MFDSTLKGIFPDTCWDCQWHEYDEYYSEELEDEWEIMECVLCEREHIDPWQSEVPAWCPLRELLTRFDKTSR